MLKMKVAAFVFLLFSCNSLSFAEDENELWSAVNDIFKACDILKIGYVGEISYVTLYNGALVGASNCLNNKNLNCRVNGIGKSNSLIAARAQFYSKFSYCFKIAQDSGVNIDDITFAAFDGAAKAINSGHTGFVAPQFLGFTNITGHYLNIGANLAKVNGCIFFHVVLPGGPAEKSGLHKFDILKEINGNPISTNIREVANLLLGEPETDVCVKVSRLGVVIEKPFVIKRSAENLPYCLSRIIKYKDKNFGYIFLRTFMADLGHDSGGVNELIAFLSNNKTNGIILDLRGNSGGYLSILQEVLPIFFNKRVLMMHIRYSNELKSFYALPEARGVGLCANVPLVVLVDGRSFSASEVFAGLIQESGRGKIVGLRTGGSVELSSFIGFSGRGKAVGMWITSGKITLPSGRVLEGSGVSPDFYAPLKELDVLLGQDSQLEAALYVLEREVRNKK